MQVKRQKKVLFSWIKVLKIEQFNLSETPRLISRLALLHYNIDFLTAGLLRVYDIQWLEFRKG